MYSNARFSPGDGLKGVNACGEDILLWVSSHQRDLTGFEMDYMSKQKAPSYVLRQLGVCAAFILSYH